MSIFRAIRTEEDAIKVISYITIVLYSLVAVEILLGVLFKAVNYIYDGVVIAVLAYLLQRFKIRAIAIVFLVFSGFAVFGLITGLVNGFAGIGYFEIALIVIWTALAVRAVQATYKLRVLRVKLGKIIISSVKIRPLSVKIIALLYLIFIVFTIFEHFAGTPSANIIFGFRISGDQWPTPFIDATESALCLFISLGIWFLWNPARLIAIGYGCYDILNIVLIFIIPYFRATAEGLYSEHLGYQIDMFGINWMLVIPICFNLLIIWLLIKNKSTFSNRFEDQNLANKSLHLT
ncbi:MAG: hypothetical protein P9M00_10555 [Candidatus Tritonobacter lacicola]|nr:hypothetical protein [Candidatus Tritonobacter lacicola]